VYAVGLFVLVVAVGFAVRSRRAALDHVEETPAREEPAPSEDTTAPPEGSDD